MADSNSQPPRCPCGFFGTIENNGLCSKCYDEQKKKSGDRSDLSASGASNNGSAAGLTPDLVIQAVSEVAASLKANSSSPQIGALEINQPTTEFEKLSEACVEVQEGNGSDLNCSQTPTGVKRDSSAIADPSKPEQKNKKRCFKCNTKLDLAHREIGRCRCEYIFCSAHRLPEQHDCIFDHKEEGRKADSEKMVLPTRHGGRSFQRLDSDRN